MKELESKNGNVIQPKVSIGIAVYNVEKYLVNCLESVINQTLKEIEIIIVDDGSTDNSGEICDNYAQKDRRIKVIHKTNGGLASARQAALNIAAGDYFCACDADDWVELDMYEQLYNEAICTNADITTCDYYADYPDKRVVEHRAQMKCLESIDLVGEVMSGRFPHMIWNKLIRRSLFTCCDIVWEDGINQGEDFLMTLKLLQHPVKLAHVPMCLYHYRRVIGGDSYTNNISLSSFNQLLAIRKWIENNIEIRKYPAGMFHLWVNLAFTGLRVKDGINSGNYRQDILSRIPYIGFLRYKFYNVKGILIFSTKVFGYGFGHFIYQKLYHKYYK